MDVLSEVSEGIYGGLTIIGSGPVDHPGKIGDYLTGTDKNGKADQCQSYFQCYAPYDESESYNVVIDDENCRPIDALTSTLNGKCHLPDIKLDLQPVQSPKLGNTWMQT